MNCIVSTPIQNYLKEFGLLVKREDLCCPPPGPPFSKMRGVIAHVASRPEEVIGVLDTSHSQGGWAVAYACHLLQKQCMNYYPIYRGKEFDALKPQQIAARDLGARMIDLPAARSAILFHRAKKDLLTISNKSTYMMPNALKLRETVLETAEEVRRTFELNSKLILQRSILVSASSGTIAAGIIRGLQNIGRPNQVIVHLGYSRSKSSVLSYLYKMSGAGPLDSSIQIVDEGYSYTDESYSGPATKWSCDKFYDLKAFRWWMKYGRQELGEAMLWNIG